MKQFDAIIIGFGKGGKTLAADLAERGWSVAMIERSDKMYGGTCINIGCIPTKALIHQAKLATLNKDSDFEDKRIFYKNAVRIKNELINSLRLNNYNKLAGNKNVTIYTGEGFFISPEVVGVKAGEEVIKLTSEHIFINTGAETVIPKIGGITDNPFVYTSTTVMDLEELPHRLVVIGGGYIGLEFASMYASFGSDVTVLESYSEFISREDRDIAACVQKTLEKKGIRIVLNADVQSVLNENGEAVVIYNDKKSNRVEMLSADAVLLATGRKPVINGLNLDAAGVKTDERGAIITDKYLKTSNPAIRALGDVRGGLQFTYISLDDYRIVREDLFGDAERTTDRNPVSYSVFIDPPLSRIGMSEAEARQKEIDIEVKTLSVASIPRVRTLGEIDGLMKSIIDKKTNRILGCTLFAPESSEVINTVALAMKNGQDYTALRDFIFTHPSMSESLNDLFAF